MTLPAINCYEQLERVAVKAFWLYPAVCLGGGVTESTGWVLWKGEMQLAHPSSLHSADVTKCLVCASLREAVGFCSPGTGYKVFAHTGFSSGLSVLYDYWWFKMHSSMHLNLRCEKYGEKLGIRSTRRGVESVNTGFRTEHMQSVLSWFCSTWKLVTILTDSKIDPSHLQDEKGVKSQNEGKKKTMCERRKKRECSLECILHVKICI